MRSSTKLLSILALFVVIFYAHSASALTVTPVRIEIQADPGQVIVKPITLINEQNTATTFYTSFANFEAQGETGNPAFVEPKSDLGTWMTTDMIVTLAPHQTKNVNITISVPQDAYAGGHFAVVFFGTQPNNAEKVSGVGIGAKTGALILLSVSGDVKEAGGLSSFKLKNNKFFYNTLPVSFQYRFKNDGNDRVKPQGNIVMHDLFYIPEDTMNANPVNGNILPHSTRLFDVDWIKHPRSASYVAPVGKVALFFDRALYQWQNFAMGPYMAKLELVYGTQGIITNKSVFFFVFPWQLIICLIIILGIVYFFGKKLIRRYNAYIIKKARAGMRPNDAHSK
jgi:hypothetical protein